MQIKRSLPWLVWACRAGTRDFCSALAALVGPVPVQNIFSSPSNFSFVPITQLAGQAAVLGHLSLNMSLLPTSLTRLRFFASPHTQENSTLLSYLCFVTQYFLGIFLLSTVPDKYFEKIKRMNLSFGYPAKKGCSLRIRRIR